MSRSWRSPVFAAVVVACGCNDGPTDAPFGLDVRVSNATCVAPERPPNALVRVEGLARVLLGYLRG